jgi:hypothetical protein
MSNPILDHTPAALFDPMGNTIGDEATAHLSEYNPPTYRHGSITALTGRIGSHQFAIELNPEELLTLVTNGQQVLDDHRHYAHRNDIPEVY